MPRAETCVALALTALLVAPASGQETSARSPFRDQSVALAQAAALERIEAAGRGLAVTAAVRAGAGGPPGPQDLEGEDEIKASLAVAVQQVRASLAAADPETAAALGDAVSAVLAEDEADGRADPRRAGLAALAQRGRAALVPPELGDDPGFRAALVAALLLDEGGVADAYEEAVGGERAAYAVGFAALDRVRVHLSALQPRLGGDEAAALAAAVSALADLFPTPTAPSALSPDPEDAEALAQQLVASLETAVGADLYPGRDFADAAAVIRDLAGDGCAAVAGGAGAAGLERLAIARSYYLRTISAPLKVVAPELAKRIRAGLYPVRDGEGDAMAAACPDLLDALAAGRSVLAP
ncbi:hypothetical protein [Prosthecomicrobium sp. N25]|uniref:hypothetical protein n=1 Tax=Prosthecomicrobium sp. N25 TaxID=3129254 RepID=UPI003077030E